MVKKEHNSEMLRERCGMYGYQQGEKIYYESSSVANHKNISDSETRKNVLEGSWEYHRIVKVKLKTRLGAARRT